MYVETLLWLQNQPIPNGWDTVRNAVLEDHLVHARALINFLGIGDACPREDDVVAEDYFHDAPNVFRPLHDTFLSKQAQAIGGQAVHITKKSMPNLRSQKDWPIPEIAKNLVPVLKTFLIEVPETRLSDGVRQHCLDNLAKLNLPYEINVSLHTTT